MSMAERVLYEVIKEGLDWYKADTGKRFERFLTEYMRLGAEEVAKARIYFAGGLADGETVEAQPPNLIHGYARTSGPFPCWALVLGAEREVLNYLGDDAAFIDADGEHYLDPETGQIIDPKIKRVEYTFNILVITRHPDVTVWYYQLLKHIIMQQHHILIERDLSDPSLSGADLAPDPRYLPSDVFVRQLTVQLQSDEPWTEILDGFGSSISGIHLDDTEAEKTRGDADSSVDAGITTY